MTDALVEGVQIPVALWMEQAARHACILRPGPALAIDRSGMRTPPRSSRDRSTGLNHVPVARAVAITVTVAVTVTVTSAGVRQGCQNERRVEGRHHPTECAKPRILRAAATATAASPRTAGSRSLRPWRCR
jgi:hypothetical protein